MQGSKYRFKFYLNAIHSIDINKKRGQEHPHTWEIVIYTLQLSDQFIMFTEIEKKIEDFLSRFQDKNLNLMEPFNSINPTLENISNVVDDNILSSVLSSVETAKNVAEKQKDLFPELDFYMDKKYSKITDVPQNNRFSYEQVKKMIETNKAEIEAGRKRAKIMEISFGALMILAIAVVCVLKFYLHLF